MVATPKEGKECELFQLGRDVDHVRLQVLEDISEELEIHLLNNRVLSRKDLFKGLLHETNNFLDHDIRESSKDDCKNGMTMQYSWRG